MRYTDTFTTTRVGRKMVVSSILPSQHALSVAGVGGKLTSWTVTLDGSLDGVHWTTLLTHNATEGSTVYPSDAILRPVRYLRVNVTALSLGDASAAKVFAVSKA